MINWLKRRIAWRELDELERWKVAESSLRQWLAEFPDVRDTLDHLRVVAAGSVGLNESKLRERLRVRRDFMRKFDETIASLTPRTMTATELDWLASIPPVDRDEAYRRCGVKSMRQVKIEDEGWTDGAVADAERKVATDWDVANVNDAMLAHIHSTSEWLACNVHSEPAPGRIDYRFLGVTGEES
jgi:hypothetical protein